MARSLIEERMISEPNVLKVYVYDRLRRGTWEEIKNKVESAMNSIQYRRMMLAGAYRPSRRRPGQEESVRPD